MKNHSGNLRNRISPPLAAILIIFSSCGHLPDRKELLNYKNATASLVFSEENELIGRIFSEERTNISYDQIPDHIKNALIATEDIRFFEHKGNDLRSMIRVIVKTILFRDRSSGGGSTITQQLAKNMYGRRKKGLMPVINSKFREMRIARRIEKTYSKQEILTLYLNTVSFGENIYGIESAAYRFFGKSTELLKIEESATLIGMLKANTIYNPRLHPDNARRRRNVVLQQMEKYGYLSPSEVDSISGLPMVLNYKKNGPGGPADYYLVRVRNELTRILSEVESRTGRKWNPEDDGLVIRTTINLALQRYAIRSFQDHLPAMQARLKKQYQSQPGRYYLDQVVKKELERLNLNSRAEDIIVQEIFDWSGNKIDSISVSDSLRKALTTLHAGLIAVDPINGDIKAWVGGIDFKTQPYDQILARRQLASVFKPVLYAAALEEGMEPCQYLDNDSVILSDFKDWSPENYDHTYGGKYSLAGALAQSMNIPTYSLFLQLGFEKTDSMWRKMGFSFELDNTPSLALGTAEANILEVSSAYSAFSNGGFLIVPHCISSIETANGELIFTSESVIKKRIISERTSLLMRAMLQKAIKEGTGTSLGNNYGIDIPLAGKTGTSTNYADAWFAVFNPRIVMVARAGASTPAIHFNNGAWGSGSALALPLVALTVKKIRNDMNLNERFIAPFPDLPPELVSALDCPDFREKSFFEIFIDIFEPRKRPYDNREEEIERKIRSILKKIFKKNRNNRRWNG